MTGGKEGKLAFDQLDGAASKDAEVVHIHREKQLAIVEPEAAWVARDAHPMKRFDDAPKVSLPMSPGFWVPIERHAQACARPLQVPSPFRTEMSRKTNICWM